MTTAFTESARANRMRVPHHPASIEQDEAPHRRLPRLLIAALILALAAFFIT